MRRLLTALGVAVVLLGSALSATTYYDISGDSYGIFHNAVPSCGDISYRITATDQNGVQVGINTYAPTSSMVVQNSPSTGDLTVYLADVQAQMNANGNTHTPVTLKVTAFRRCGGTQESTVAILD